MRNNHETRLRVSAEELKLAYDIYERDFNILSRAGFLRLCFLYGLEAVSRMKAQQDKQFLLNFLQNKSK